MPIIQEFTKPLYKKFTDKIGTIPLVLFIAIFVILSTYSFSTRNIPIAKKLNTTDAFNNTIEIETIYSYAYKEYIPKERSFEYENTQIPKKSFPFEGVLLIMIAVIGLHMYNIKKGEKVEPAKIEEIRKEAKDYLELMKKEGEIKDYDLKMGGFLREKQVDSGDKIPESWFLPTDVITVKEEPEHRVIGFNPFTRNVKSDFKVEKEFRGEDTCPTCGKFFHQKIISPEGYTIYRDTFAPRPR